MKKKTAKWTWRSQRQKNLRCINTPRERCRRSNLEDKLQPNTCQTRRAMQPCLFGQTKLHYQSRRPLVWSIHRQQRGRDFARYYSNINCNYRNLKSHCRYKIQGRRPDRTRKVYLCMGRRPAIEHPLENRCYSIEGKILYLQ